MSNTQAELSVRCAFCDGTGRDRFGILSPPSACQVCLGRGVVGVPEPRVPCAYCRGRGVQPHTRLTGAVAAEGARDRPGTARDLFPLRRGRRGPPERAQAVLPRLPRRRGGPRRRRAVRAISAALRSLRLPPCDTQLPDDGRKQTVAGAQAGYLDVRRQDPRHLVLQADEQHSRAGDGSVLPIRVAI